MSARSHINKTFNSIGNIATHIAASKIQALQDPYLSFLLFSHNVYFSQQINSPSQANSITLGVIIIRGRYSLYQGYPFTLQELAIYNLFSNILFKYLVRRFDVFFLLLKPYLIQLPNTRNALAKLHQHRHKSASLVAEDLCLSTV
jgi:hypothetical protein